VSTVKCSKRVLVTRNEIKGQWEGSGSCADAAACPSVGRVKFAENRTGSAQDDCHATSVGASSIQLARPTRDACGSSWNVPFNVCQ